MESTLEQVRNRCRWVTESTRSVIVQRDRLDALAADLARSEVMVVDDPARRPLADEIMTVSYVLTLDAINFGSGWFHLLRKLPGLSGYQTLATLLRQRFERLGPLSPDALAHLTPGDCATLLGQEWDGPLTDLLRFYSQSLNDLGEFVSRRFEGKLATIVQAACNSTERLTDLLREMPLYRDVAVYQGTEVPFYKRAQITAADLALSLGGVGLGRFHDLNRLTVFADNIIPHVLRCYGVLRYDHSVATAIDAGEPLLAGSEVEIEVRAAAVHVVELLVRLLHSSGHQVTAMELDSILWCRGHTLRDTSFVPHRTYTAFY